MLISFSHFVISLQTGSYDFLFVFICGYDDDIWCFLLLCDSLQACELSVSVRSNIHSSAGHIPPIVLSWNSWNWPLTKRRTRLDFPTADSPKSTSLNWQILLPAFGPLGRVAPPLLAMSHCPVSSSGRWCAVGKYLSRRERERENLNDSISVCSNWNVFIRKSQRTIWQFIVRSYKSRFQAKTLREDSWT